MDGPEQLSLEPPAAEPPPAAPAAPPAPAPTGPDLVHPPTDQQACAIGERDRDVFLEAGAGTGKTRVLVERYCEAVDADGIEPERILAFTFTEKAAAEMRRRIRIELGRRAAAAEDPERRARLQEAARAGEAAAITTIHGFSRRLLAAHPIAAGLDPRFRVLDTDEAGRMARAAFDEALALAGGDEAVALTAAGYRARLASIVMTAHSDLRNRGAVEPKLPELELGGIDNREEPPTAAEAAAIAAGWEALGRLLAEFGGRYGRLKAERSAVDFDDLQLLALELLRSNEAIAAAQRSRFDHLLVDEFQDTSPIQLELVRALAGPETRTFTVGDAAQSIYGFRGADLESFLGERERLAAGAGERDTAMLGLTGSFRSTPDVLAMVNLVGAVLLDGYRPLSVGKPPTVPSGPEGPAVEILLTRAKGWGEEDEGTAIETVATDTPQSRIAEARGLARRLRELADEGVDPGSMVVLLRAFTHVDAYAEALELAGLDPYIVGGRGYWSSQQVTDALNLLACVANPLDDESLLGALASPAAAVGPDALWILRRVAGKRHIWKGIEAALDPSRDDPANPEEGGEEVDPELLARRAEQRRWAERLDGGDRELLRRFRDTLVELRATASLLPLDDLVERTLEAFGYDLAALQMDDGLRRTANLMKLVRIAGEYEAHEGRDLRGLLDQAASRAALSDREAEAAVAAEDHAGVRVMTVHAAKGLEFDCVAVADLGRKLATGGRPAELRLAFDSASGEEPASAPRIGLRLARAGAGPLDVAGYKQLNDEAADADAEESGRLAYVAASRARSRLLLSGLFDPDDDLAASEKPRRQLTALACLLPALGVDGSDGQIVTAPAPEALPGVAESAFDPAPVRVRVTGPGRDQAARLAIDARGPREAAVANGGAPPMLALAERGTAAARTLSYAALAAYQRCGYRFLAERILRLGRDGDGIAAVDGSAPGRPGGAGFGRAVHELLEWSARSSWRPPPAELVAATLRREGLGDDAGAAELVAAWLGSKLLAGLREAGAGFRPEVRFRIGLGAATVIRGTIDLLVSRPGEPPLFVDYKTDAIPPSGPALPPGYELQRLLYAAAIAEATGSDRVASAYVFLRAPAEPIVATLGPEEIAAGKVEIEALIARIRGGDFDPTPDPGPALCHDCPARARLCPHPPERTLGTAP